ncbi:MAG: hypothetical protein HZA48_10680 [Planctomycetes bacterium]|nr:hypothetical protein [Planctomycetota bacterium]
MRIKTIALLALLLCQLSCRMPVRWVSDGKGRIFAVNDKAIHVIENDKPALIDNIEKDVSTDFTCADFNADKDMLAIAGSSSVGVDNKIHYIDIWAIGIADKKKTVLAEEPGQLVFDLKWLNHNIGIAYTRIDDANMLAPKIQLRIVYENAKSRLLLNNSTIFFGLYKNDDKGYIVAGRAIGDSPDFREVCMGEIVALDIETGGITKLFDSAYSPLSNFAVLSDMEILVSIPEIKLPFLQKKSNIDEITHGIFRFNAETKTLTKVSPENKSVIFFALSPDKNKMAWIVEEGNKLQIADLSGKTIAEVGTTEWLEFVPFWRDNNVVCYMEEIHSGKPEESIRNLVFYDCKEKKFRQASKEINVLLPAKGVKVPENAGRDGK